MIISSKNWRCLQNPLILDAGLNHMSLILTNDLTFQPLKAWKVPHRQVTSHFTLLHSRNHLFYYLLLRLLYLLRNISWWLLHTLLISHHYLSLSWDLLLLSFRHQRICYDTAYKVGRGFTWHFWTHVIVVRNDYPLSRLNYLRWRYRILKDCLLLWSWSRLWQRRCLLNYLLDSHYCMWFKELWLVFIVIYLPKN